MLAIFVVPRPFNKAFRGCRYPAVDTARLCRESNASSMSWNIPKIFPVQSLLHSATFYLLHARCRLLPSQRFLPKGKKKKKKKWNRSFIPVTMDAKLCFQHLSCDVTRYRFIFMYLPVKMKIRRFNSRRVSIRNQFVASLKLTNSFCQAFIFLRINQTLR